MRKLLFSLFIVFLLAACNREDLKPALTRVIVDVQKQKLGSSGNVTVEPKSAFIHLWRAEDKEFDVAASGSDIYLGSVYDKVSKSYKTADYGAIGVRMDEQIKPGKYFVYVALLKSSSAGSLAYSYTNIEIKKGETLELKKIFGHDIGSEQFEEWFKNQ